MHISHRYLVCINLVFSLREIFGPILPLVEVEDVHEAMQIIGDRFVSGSKVETITISSYTPGLTL